MAVKQQIDHLIVNGEIFTGERASPYIKDGAIAVDGGRILAIGDTRALSERYLSPDFIDAGGAIVHPGMIDTHIHATSIALHSLPVSIDEISQSKVSYADVKVQTDDESTDALVAAAAVALLRRGYTCFMEAGTVFETDAFASALQRIGMRGMVSAPFGWDDVSDFESHAPGMITKRLLERAPADRATVIRRLERELTRNADKDPLVTGYVCLYGEGSATDALTRDAIDLALEAGVIFNQHQGFIHMWRELETRKYGKSGVARLHQLGALHERTTLSHMNSMSDLDAELVVEHRPGITWCPNNALHRAVHPADPCRMPKLIEQSVCVSLGIDTTMYHALGTAGMASLLLSATSGQRLDDAEPFYMQTANAARNIGFSDELGTLSVGKRADIVVRASEDITHTAMEKVGGLLALSSSQIPVDVVIIDGKLVMKGGRLTRVDQAEVLHHALAQRRRVLERAAT
ncbi:amidohydrolase family protein (plasmid) [Sinorhizobium numidicum]|uniref:Amidohydrolase family protein n=1 Tax=Sinorhizobium numidicum TaxID=680248 RepID=A0ABY8D377_9HYPH|nr:amidohydrolase family protein [Sinorhizobium numidicum]WEX79288.1 amidohydrolase family protein [Sinorhizobium numidicum]WEX85341.1 amidohydrolase family protein [Sinorhizobium numidicum]